MLSLAALQEALQAHVPAQYHEQARLLARLIVAAAQADDADRLTTSAEFMPLLKQLAGSSFSTPQGTVTFGPGSQTGDITVHDVAGENIINVTVNLPNPAAPEESHTTYLARPTAEVGRELADLIVRGRSLQQATAKNQDSAAGDDTYSLSVDWHRWRRQAEALLEKSFSTLDPLHHLRKLTPQHMISAAAPAPQRRADLAHDVQQDLAFLEDLHQRLQIYER